MNINQLKYFVEIAKYNSFTLASEKLFISQPSLSLSIRKLEKNLGVRLINREKGNSLTSSGEFLLAHSQKLLTEVEFIQTKIHQLKQSNNKALKIGILKSLSSVKITSLISCFSEKHSDIVIKQSSGNMKQLEEWLAKDYVDLAIGTLKEPEENKVTQTLFYQVYQLSISQKHYLCSKESLCFSDLDGLPYIDRVQCEIREELQNLFLDRKILPKVIYTTDYDELSNSLVMLDKGVAIMPVNEDQKLGILNLPFIDIDLSRAICLISNHSNSNNFKTINLFRDFASNYFKLDLA